MAATVNLEEFDKHIQSVQSQINFLAKWLDSVHDADWLASEIITLKGGTSMLYDKWRHLRRRTIAEGIAVGGAKQTPSEKKGNRLSIEGVNSLNLESRNGSRSGTPKESSSAGASSSRKRSLGQLTPPVKPQQSEIKTQQAPPPPQEQQNEPAPNDDSYQVQYVDVSAVVNRRLQESRLRQLMETTPTSQKRKRDALEEKQSAGGAGGGEQDEEVEETEDMLAMLMSPTKKLKTFGHFEQAVANGDQAGKGGVLKKRGVPDSGTDTGQSEEKREEGRASGSKRRRM